MATFLAETLRLEGRGDHAAYELCPRCDRRKGDYRCTDCLGGGELLCGECLVKAHRQLPFHRVERWTGSMFEQKSLKELGLRIQLGHWHGKMRACSNPLRAAGDDFVIIDVLGIHRVGLDYCGCGHGGHPSVQLFRAGLWAATTTNPKTAVTFAVLRKYHLLSFESKCAALEFYQSLARETNNLKHKKDKDRYHEFLRMTRQWRHIRMLKRAGGGHDPGGIANTKPGECALLCPACPQPGKNLPQNWAEAPEEQQFLYALFLAMDANFRLKRKDVSTEEKDPGLMNGGAFFCEVKAYMKHVKKFWNDKQERSHCVAHDAVDKPDREARGTASSGIGAVDCARHNMKRPNAVGDLQLGERYMNMDYMFFLSIAGSELVRFFVSYDIACQWHINIWNRMLKYKDKTLMCVGAKFMTFLVPKFHLPAHIEECNLRFSFNLTRDVGQTDGEAPERGWANANPLARSTKEMGPGSRRDTLDDHFNDWNYKKIIALGYMMRKKTQNAVPEMVRTRQAFADMNESFDEEDVKAWMKMAKLWERDIRNPNPFETMRKEQHVAKVRLELAEAAAAAGKENAREVRGDMHITELIAMGLQLEDQQRVLASDVSGTGLHPTDGQRCALIDSKLRRKIFAWIDVQTKFFPGLRNVREREDEARAQVAASQHLPVPGTAVSDVALWLPSAMAAAKGADASDTVVDETHLDHEYKLRVGQAAEALHELRRGLLVRTHLYKQKDTHSRGVAANTRSADKIGTLNEQIKRSAAQYRVARRALETLGGVPRWNEWEWVLQELKEDNIRGLPRARFSDPTRKKKKLKGSQKQAKVPERPLSWIWVNRGERWDPGDDVAMNEAVRIEWAKARARSLRWGEEVYLLEEEMRRIGQFLVWRSDWWKEQVGRRSLEEGPQLEGETAYALRQAAIQAKLAVDFATEWKDLPDLIRRGRAGETVEEEGSDNDEQDEGAGAYEEEHEPILTLPQREVKSTHVDEVLEM
ncbi:hypothetical protein DFH07DRAFT_774758 [Mycena maculata]|uniref:CxC2-like cysteine cluster KDZ transposase-associated domain-containing protein n=1 Tax=Mycena maculata TaxID=230809 RepID=A0AAD7NAG5_9AGAR|nr:hypothetical protein DFH07DRAFT_774758 [Mycena maculata]